MFCGTWKWNKRSRPLHLQISLNLSPIDASFSLTLLSPLPLRSIRWKTCGDFTHSKSHPIHRLEVPTRYSSPYMRIRQCFCPRPVSAPLAIPHTFSTDSTSEVWLGIGKEFDYQPKMWARFQELQARGIFTKRRPSLVVAVLRQRHILITMWFGLVRRPRFSDILRPTSKTIGRKNEHWVHGGGGGCQVAPVFACESQNTKIDRIEQRLIYTRSQSEM